MINSEQSEGHIMKTQHKSKPRNLKLRKQLSNRYRLANIKLTAIREYLFNHCLNHVKNLGCLPSKFSLWSMDDKQELLTIPYKDYHLFLKASDMKKLQKWQRDNAICRL